MENQVTNKNCDLTKKTLETTIKIKHFIDLTMEHDSLC